MLRREPVGIRSCLFCSLRGRKAKRECFEMRVGGRWVCTLPFKVFVWFGEEQGREVMNGNNGLGWDILVPRGRTKWVL